MLLLSKFTTNLIIPSRALVPYLGIILEKLNIYFHELYEKHKNFIISNISFFQNLVNTFRQDFHL